MSFFAQQKQFLFLLFFFLMTTPLFESWSSLSLLEHGSMTYALKVSPSCVRYPVSLVMLSSSMTSYTYHLLCLLLLHIRGTMPSKMIFSKQTCCFICQIFYFPFLFFSNQFSWILSCCKMDMFVLFSVQGILSILLQLVADCWSGRKKLAKVCFVYKMLLIFASLKKNSKIT